MTGGPTDQASGAGADEVAGGPTDQASGARADEVTGAAANEAARPTGEATLDEVAQIVRAAVHELNNPLATLALAASLVRSADSAEQRDQVADLLDAEAQRAGRIASDLRERIVGLAASGRAPGGPRAADAGAGSTGAGSTGAGSTGAGSTGTGSTGAGSASSAGPAKPPPSARGKVLVVDDQPQVRQLLTQRLERDGWTVVSAADAAGATAALHAGPVDAALVDLHLAGPGGQQVLVALEGLQAGITDRAAFITGDPPPGGLIGGRPVLGKPFAPEELDRLLRSLIGPL